MHSMVFPRKKKEPFHSGLRAALPLRWMLKAVTNRESPMV